MSFAGFLVCIEGLYHTVIYYATQFKPANCFGFFFFNPEGKLQIFT